MVKSARSPNWSKSDYIRAHESIPAVDLVAQAKREGIKLSPAFIHTVRSAARRKARTRASAGPMPANPVRVEDKLANLRRLVLEVGYDAASEVLDRVRAELGLGR
jgi:hypothetical protein